MLANKAEEHRYYAPHKSLNWLRLALRTATRVVLRVNSSLDGLHFMGKNAANEHASQKT
jgi:hypothetical protein